MFKLEIDNFDSSAFTEDLEGEIARLLRRVACKVEAGDDFGILFDSNCPPTPWGAGGKVVNGW